MENELEMKQKEPIMQVNSDFYQIVEDFKEKFKEKHGLKLSNQQATKIIAEKINRIGGIKV